MELNNKTICLIGSSGILRDSKLGKLIDKFDIVIRVNNAITYGFEEDVGTKFDIWITFNPEQLPNPWTHKKWLRFGETFKMLRELRLSDNDISEHLSSVKEVWYTTWKEKDLTENWMKDELLVKYLDDPDIRVQSLEYAKLCKKELGLKQGTGFNAIWVLSKMLDHFYIAGFDFYGNTNLKNKYLYYYNDRDINSMPMIHDGNLEYKYVKNLIDDGKVIMLDNNTNITPSEFISRIKHSECEVCGYKYDVYEWQQDICSRCKYEQDERCII